MDIFNINNHISKSDLEFWNLPINDDFGVGLELKNEKGEDAFSWVRIDKDEYRNVELKISSWIGAFGAEHFYGTLRSYDLNFTNNKESIGKSSISGAFEIGLPNIYTEFFKLELKRPYNKRDKENDEKYGRDRWLSYDIGDLTRGFWTEEEVVEVGKQVFKTFFKGRWKLTINSWSGDLDETIYLNKI